MSYFSVDVEADGPVPGLYSMVSFGAVLIDETLNNTFYGKVKPISKDFIPDALAISGHSREETEAFEDPALVIKKFYYWIIDNSRGRPIFLSDNNGFDWMFTCYYFHKYMGDSPFGHSSQNLNSLYKGISRNSRGHGFYREIKP